MPRLKRRARVVECEAHGFRCALGGGSRYVSERCEPATEKSQQEIDLIAMIATG